MANTSFTLPNKGKEIDLESIYSVSGNKPAFLIGYCFTVTRLDGSRTDYCYQSLLLCNADRCRLISAHLDYRKGVTG